MEDHPELNIDTARLVFKNELLQNVSLWTQFEECIKCPLLPAYPNITNPNHTDYLNFPSYYTLRYQVYENSAIMSEFTPLCDGILSMKDQSVWNIIVKDDACNVENIYKGRNDALPLGLAIVFIVLAVIVFYGGRFLYNKFRKLNSNEDHELAEKISQRLNSLDAFRGLTILLMIFVNWGAGKYHILDHAEWDGMHFADFIFPSFIFIMGVTMAISLRSMVVKKSMALTKVYWSIVKRSIKLILVGLILNSRGNADLRYLRIPGVLQRFGLTYLFVGIVHTLSLSFNKDQLYHMNYLSDILPYWPDWILAGIMMILYFSLTFGWKFDPNCPLGYLGPGGYHDNSSYPYCVGGAANKLDRIIFGENHMYDQFTAKELYDSREKFGLMHDPEGALGVTTSVILAIIGLQVGKVLLTYSSTKQRLIRWAAWALALTVLTAALFIPIPINKNLWSFTFVTLTGATSIALFTLFYLLIDHFKVWPCGQPLHYPGMNSILLYIGHDFTGGMLPFAFIEKTNSHAWHLTQNIIGVFLWLLISIYLAKKKYFLTL